VVCSSGADTIVMNGQSQLVGREPGPGRMNVAENKPPSPFPIPGRSTSTCAKWRLLPCLFVATWGAVLPLGRCRVRALPGLPGRGLSRWVYRRKKRAIARSHMSCLIALLHSIIRERRPGLLEHPKNIYATIAVPCRWLRLTGVLTRGSCCRATSHHSDATGREYVPPPPSLHESSMRTSSLSGRPLRPTPIAPASLEVCP
jgi:hypothetical protein